MVTKNLNKKRTIYLSRKERRIGGKLFLRLSAFNGLGTSFLSDSTIALLAIHFGAGNVEMGIISAMMYISGIILLAVPRVFRNKNIVTVGFWAWITRGIVSIVFSAVFYGREESCLPYNFSLCSFLYCKNNRGGYDNSDPEKTNAFKNSK